jgi:hypothetical protein
MSRDEYCLKAYNNKQVLSVHALVVFLSRVRCLQVRVEGGGENSEMEFVQR